MGGGGGTSVSPAGAAASAGAGSVLSEGAGQVPQVQVLADLREFEFGPRWTWELAGEREDLVLWQPEHRAGAESLREFQTRVVAAFESALRRHGGGSVERLVCVIHSGVLDALLRWAFGCTAESPWVIAHPVAGKRAHHWSRSCAQGFTLGPRYR